MMRDKIPRGRVIISDLQNDIEQDQLTGSFPRSSPKASKIDCHPLHRSSYHFLPTFHQNPRDQNFQLLRPAHQEEANSQIFDTFISAITCDMERHNLLHFAYEISQAPSYKFVSGTQPSADINFDVRPTRR